MNMIATLPAATPDDLLALPDEGKGYELIDGRLKERDVSTESSYIGSELVHILKLFVNPAGRGYVFGADTGFRCFPGHENRVRKPDTAFIRLDRLTPEQYYARGFCPVAPDLVAEVVSPTDVAYEVEEKVEHWLAAGVRVVWVIHPETRTVRVHRADGGYAFLRAADTLTADDVLPGFARPVADLFRLPGGPA